MAIEKFSGKFSVENGGCTIIINETINSIRNSDGAALYSYLICRPSTWELNIENLRKHYGWGKQKAYNALTYLQNIHLLKKIEHRIKGRFIKHEYILMLRPFSPLLKNWEVEETQADTDLSPLPSLPEAVPPEVATAETYKTKRSTKQKKEEIKEYINNAHEEISQKGLVKENPWQESTFDTSYKETHNVHFQSFWQLYPKKTGENKCRAQWINDKCDDKWPMIREKLIEQIEQDDQWKDGCIPSSFNYIKDELWKDEIVKRKKSQESKQKLDHHTRDWATKFKDRLF